MDFVFSLPIITENEAFAVAMSADIVLLHQNISKAEKHCLICEKLGLNFPIKMKHPRGFKANFTT